jgi:hypothetical protein
MKDIIASKRGGRWWLIQHTPDVFIDYLLESLLVAVSWLVVLGYASGRTARNSAILGSLPQWVVHTYMVILVLGAATGSWALLTKAWGTWLATAMKTLGLAFVIYAIAVVVTVGLDRAWQTFLTTVLCGAMAFWRAFLLTSTFRIEYEIVRRQNDGTLPP